DLGRVVVTPGLHVRRRIFGPQIAPALERPLWIRHRPHDLRRHDDVAVILALGVRVGRQSQDALPAADRARHYPVDRGYAFHFRAALGRHGGAMDMHVLAIIGAPPMCALVPIALQFLHAGHAHAEFDHMDHARVPGATRPWITSISSSSTIQGSASAMASQSWKAGSA